MEIGGHILQKFESYFAFCFCGMVDIYHLHHIVRTDTKEGILRCPTNCTSHGVIIFVIGCVVISWPNQREVCG